MQVSSCISTVIYNFSDTIKHKRSLANCRIETMDCWVRLMQMLL